MSRLVRHHVVGKGGVNCPPVTCNIEEDEKPEENGEKYFDRAPPALVHIQHLVQGISPQANNFPDHLGAFVRKGDKIGKFLGQLSDKTINFPKKREEKVNLFKKEVLKVQLALMNNIVCICKLLLKCSIPYLFPVLNFPHLWRVRIFVSH